MNLAAWGEKLSESEIAGLKEQGVRISLRINERRLHKLLSAQHNLALFHLFQELLEINAV